MKKPAHLGKGTAKEKPAGERLSKEEGKGVSRSVPPQVLLVGILCGVCVACALVLGITDLLTRDRIAANQEAWDLGALVEALPYGERYDKVNYTGSDATVEEVYRARGVGCAVQVTPAGSFGKELTVMVGVNEDGTVAGVAVVNSGRRRAWETGSGRRNSGSSLWARRVWSGWRLTAVISPPSPGLPSLPGRCAWR